MAATRALRKLAVVEVKLLLREPIALCWGIAFPVALMVIMGLFSGGPDADLGGQRLVDSYQPVSIVFVVAVLAVQGMPGVLAGYRERGVLRRLATTPVGERAVLAAQLVVNLLVTLVATAGILLVGRFAFHTTLPREPVGFLVALLLMAAAALALGLLVAAVAPTGRSANALGAILFFPLMFFAGLWIPRAMMSPTLRGISDITPLGAAVRAMQASVAGQWPTVGTLAVLAGYAVIFAAVASRVFRWS